MAGIPVEVCTYESAPQDPGAPLVRFHGRNRNVQAYRQASTAVAGRYACSSRRRCSTASASPTASATCPTRRGGEAAIRRYLAQPVPILLDTADVPDQDLDKRPAAMRPGATSGA